MHRVQSGLITGIVVDSSAYMRSHMPVSVVSLPQVIEEAGDWRLVHPRRSDCVWLSSP